MTDDRVELVARAIDPEAWKRRDEDLQRREEWDAGIKFGWGKMTFERWANRSVRKSLETARAVFRTLDPSIESLQAEVAELRRIISSLGYCTPDASLEFMALIPAEIRQALAAKEQTRDR